MAKLLVRLPDAVHTALKQRATESSFSMNDLVVEACEHYLDSPVPPRRPPRRSGAGVAPDYAALAVRCQHPVGSRIGTMCALCGSKVGR